MSDSDDSSPKQFKRRKSPQVVNVNSRELQLIEENDRLRKKLKQLSLKLDDQLEKAAKQRMKYSISFSPTTSNQSQNLQLQNANKIIQRLQKAVKDYESKQSYLVSNKRIFDLEAIVKKKETEIQQIKTEIKKNKKLMREKEKTVDELIGRQSLSKNLNEEKETIAKLKDKLRKMLTENDKYKKNQMEKQKKLFEAEQRIIDMEQEYEPPIGKAEQIVKELEEMKNKYKQAMHKVEKQNIHITKLNSKLSAAEQQAQNPRRARSHNNSMDGGKISRSVEELPSLENPNKVRPTIFDHIPSPNIPIKMLRRY